MLPLQAHAQWEPGVVVLGVVLRSVRLHCEEGPLAEVVNNHQWATWRRQLADMQIDPDVALRKAMAIGDMEKDDFDFRCLERATISMHGLLALLLRWVCFPDSRGRLIQDFEHACHLLATLCGMLRGQWLFKAFVDERCTRLPPEGVIGAHPVVLHLDGGKVDVKALLPPLRGAGQGDLYQFIFETGESGPIAVMELMQGLCVQVGKLSHCLAH